MPEPREDVLRDWCLSQAEDWRSVSDNPGERKEHRCWAGGRATAFEEVAARLASQDTAAEQRRFTVWPCDHGGVRVEDGWHVRLGHTCAVCGSRSVRVEEVR